MADFYYRYNNGGDNMILNDAYLASTNPVTSGLHRRFKASDFNDTTKVWTDSATGATITATGNVTLVSHIGDKQYRTMNAVQFDTTGKVLFNNDTLTNYTLFTITRYGGVSGGRIIDGTNANFISGHHSGDTGISYKEGWLADVNQLYLTNFFIGTDTATQYRTNGITIVSAAPSNSITWLPSLALNGPRYSQFSDGQMLDLLIYDRVLTDLEKKKVEQYLASYYGLLDLSGNLTANYYRTPLATETSLLVSTTDNLNWIVYPTFGIQQTGLTFAMWFKTTGTGNYKRLFDFGNGPESDNIYAFIYENNLGFSAYPTGPTENRNQFQLLNVYPNCNDNVWRHLIWTISADGLTWKVYINKVLQATITKTSASSYSVGIGGYLLEPFHPRSIIRTSNYIGKSNWNDPAFTGSIDDFRMYNYALDQTAVNSIYMDTGSMVPKYFRERLSTETSMLVSTPTNRNYIIYPSFNITQTGMTFALWFRSNLNTTWYRIFDFGNGQSMDNIIVYIHNNALGVAVYNISGSGTNCSLSKVFPLCNDNVWRHLVWTISADGLTWKVYINKVLTATINSTNYTTYTDYTTIAPCHPSITLRSSNYIFRSNTTNEINISFDGAVHSFQMWNSPLDQTAINALYTDTTFTGSYTLSQFPSLQKLYGDPPFLLNPVSTGSGTFSFTSSNPSVATIVDNVVTITGIGKTTLTALQWSTSITATLTVVSASYTKQSKSSSLSNYQTIMNGTSYDLTEFIQKNSQQTINGNGTIGFGTTVNLYEKNITCESGIDAEVSFGKPKKNMWVAVGQGASPVGYSYDGINWTGASPTFEGIGVAFNGSIWVVVGRGGSNDIAISYDGITWTEKNSGLFTNDFWFTDIKWNGILFVATTSNPTKTIVYSYDGSTWSLANGANATFSTYGGCVAWNGRKWVGGGSGTYQLGYSIDGMNWNPSGTNVFSGGIGRCVAWNGTMWLAVGDGANNIAYSYDGLNWTGLGKGMISTFTEGIAWNGKLWVAVGTGTLHSISYSYDGFVWYGLGKTVLTTGRRVSWNGSMFIAVGNTMAYSYDGINWTGLGSPFSALRHDIAHNGLLENRIVLKRQTYVAAGTVMAQSYDGFSWKTVYNPFTTGRGIAYSGKLWVAVGEGSNALAYSMDGIIWAGITGLTTGKCIGFSGSLWVAGGNALATSTSGFSFSSITSPFTECNGIAWNGSLWVAVGNTMAWSTNGTTWTTTTSLFTTGYGVAWNGKMFVACGKGTNVLAWSTDGKTWTAGTTKAGDNTTLLGDKYVCAAWNGTIWIAGGNTLVYSYDGKVWITIQNVPFITISSILWDGKKWLATGLNTYAYSLDGFKWVKQNSFVGYSLACSRGPEMSIYMNYPSVAVGSSLYYSDGLNWTTVAFPTIKPDKQSLPGYCAAWNGNMWIVGVNDGVIYSYDGKTWTSVNYSMSSVDTIDPVRAIAWSGTMWVAGDMYYSYDGLDWNRGTTTFTTVNQITWNGFMFMATGSGTNALAYSYDGKTWNKVISPLTTGYSVAYNGLWVAVGEGTTDSMAYSYDGKTWIGLGSLFTTGYAVANNGTLWVASGTNNLAYSYDGLAWIGLGNIITGKAITWNGSRWIVTGSTNSAYSADGQTWIISNELTANGIASQSDKITTDSLQFFSESTVAVGVKGTLY